VIEPFKYLIQPVALERDEHGRVIAERIAQPVTAYNLTQVTKVVYDFEQEIERLNQEGAQHGGQDNGRAEAVVAERAPAGNLRRP